jgi:putative protease
VAELNGLRIGFKRKALIRKVSEVENIRKDNKINLNILVRNKEQLEIAMELNLDNIYVTDYSLYIEYKDRCKNLYYRTSRVINNYPNVDKALVTELGGLNKYRGKNFVSDYYLNVVNSKSISYLEKLGVSRVTLSVEDDYNYLKDIDFSNHNVEIIIYGRVELMITKYCPLKEIFKDCHSCRKNKNKYYLEDKFKNRYPLVKEDCLTTIMHCKNIDKREFLSQYIEWGINNYRIELFDETSEEIKKIIKDIRSRYNK